MKLIEGETCPSVWLEAAGYLAKCPKREDFDVFLGIKNPTVYSAVDRKIHDALDSFFRSHSGSRLETVAETIFPLSDYLREGSRGVYESYPTRINKIRSARDNDRRWGTYALRLIESRIDPKGRKYSPLGALIEKIKARPEYRAAHELNLGTYEGDIEIYDADRDRLRPYGGPCLSHLSFKVYDGKVRLNATYRSHYYTQRLLGNLIGLGRLQFFVATEAGLQVGPLTINSTFARLDTGAQNGESADWGSRDVLQLIAQCRGFNNSSSAQVTRGAEDQRQVHKLKPSVA